MGTGNRAPIAEAVFQATCVQARNLVTLIHIRSINPEDRKHVGVNFILRKPLQS